MKKMFLVFSMSIMLLVSACAPAPRESSPVNPPSTGTLESSEPSEPVSSDKPLTIAQVEALAGFDVKEPAYLPTGVSFEFATYRKSPDPIVTLYFKIVHEQYGDMGRFFQIMQEQQAEAPSDTVSCTASAKGCELLDISNQPVVYHQYASPAGEGIGTEGLDWYADGFVFRLLRVAGEPNKIYKEELIKVVNSLK